MTADRRYKKRRTADRRRLTADGRIKMPYKFEKLEVWKLALEYLNLIYVIANKLPSFEEYNLKSQVVRAATGIALNIAEGSTSQTDPEQARFLGIALRSLIETVACQHLIKQRGYLKDPTLLDEAYQFSEKLFAKIQAFRKNVALE